MPDEFNFPSPALPGSGAMGMISARLFGAPPLESSTKIRQLLLFTSSIFYLLLLSSIAFSIAFFNHPLPHPLSPSPKGEGGTEFEVLSAILSSSSQVKIGWLEVPGNHMPCQVKGF